jgi:cell wall assembly regulator SMI1/ankyrin repeat protein
MADSAAVKKLREAAATDDPAKLKAVLAGGIPVETRDEEGQTILYWACVMNKAKAALALLQSGADANALDNWGSSPLMYAARNGNVPLVKALLAAGADVHARDSGVGTALRSAVSGNTAGSTPGHTEVVKLLIAAGAAVDAEPPRPATVLMIAASNALPEAVQALIDAGANVHTAKDMFGTALAEAIDGNRPENVEVLLKAGADPNVRLSADYNEEKLAGLTLLEMAVKLKCKKIVPLLEAAIGGTGKPAPPAKKKTSPKIAASWQRIEKCLEDRGSDVLESLGDPADNSELAALERTLRVKLPEDFKESCLVHNGQRDAQLDAPLIPPLEEFDEGRTLLNLEAIETEWGQWNDNYKQGEFDDQESDPDKGIRNDWWNPKWIPFAWDGGGNSLCLDMAPTKAGRAGQVITMSHESGRRVLLAGSFSEWLADLAETLSEAPDDE